MEKPKNTAKDRIYPLRVPKENTALVKVSLDSTTTDALDHIQHLSTLKLGKRVFSRTTIIRRALSLYINQILLANSDSDSEVISGELAILASMSNVGSLS